MIPGLLATEVAQALREFIVTGYESETEPFAGEFRRLVEEADNGEGFIKGPYMSVSLPFLQGSAGRDFFESFLTSYPPFKHQEQAWQRISSNKQGVNTLVATGTGSGKTECFLYPLLDHCKRNSGQGIKAIVIYPMNALATDQAKRFAETIHARPELAGLRVGLYVGGEQANSAKAMTADNVIACKEAMQESPPDILLTNYKMLDYMLVRPKDQKIWRHNDPETLKYLVVDELHTFDGAQGTDLALLLRRLKARLNAPENHVIHVGTSATMGGGVDAADSLLRFASDIFSSSFDGHSVVDEQRQTIDDFLGRIEHFAFLADATAERLKGAIELGFDSFLTEAIRFVFNDQLALPEIQSAESRIELGKQLRGHGQLMNLLKVLNGKPRALTELAEQMAHFFPIGFEGHEDWGLLAIFSLLAHARHESGRPLVTMRAQLWTRELRRILGRLLPTEKEKQLPLLTFADDNLKADDRSVRLPLVQCRECHGTAWLSKIEEGLKPGEAIEQSPESIYSSFFREYPHPDTAILVPTKDGLPLCSVEQPGLLRVCSECGGRHGAQHKGDCAGCGADASALVLLARPIMRREVKVKGVNTTVHDKHCPYCNASNSLIIFGARAATLSSVAVHKMFSSRDNDDKKLIAFSDSVQDATHRAGFFSARTWTENIRAAITQLLNENGDLPLPAIPEAFERFWLADKGGQFDQRRYLKEFMPPEKRYSSAFEKFEKLDVIEEFDWHASLIRQRVYWLLLQDLTWRHKVGRSLHRVGVAALKWNQGAIAGMGSLLADKLHNDLGVACDPQQAGLLANGFMHRIVAMGGFDWPELDRYAREGKTYVFNQHPSLPKTGPSSPRPMFPATYSSDAQVNVTKDKWWLDWCRLCISDGDFSLVSGKDIYSKVIEQALSLLHDEGYLQEVEHHKGRFWQAVSAGLLVTKDLCELIAESKRALPMPESMADYWHGQLQLDASGDVYGGCQPVRSHLFAEFYRKGEINRVIAHEHTGLLERKEREAVENSFIAGEKTWELNLLSATPTLEMGIDIGDLSSVLLCSVPPNQANYLQRIGRGGRRDGNSFVLTIANAKPHDLVFYASPERLFDEPVDSPAIFLKAKHVLRRQLLAYCMDSWAKELPELAEGIPQKMQPVLDAVESANEQKFPYTLLDYVAQNKTDLWQAFADQVASGLPEEDLAALRAYFVGDGSDEELRLVVLSKISLQVEERKRIKQYTERLQRDIKKLNATPESDERNSQIAELEGELGGHRRLRTQLNRRDVLNFFTDEGLLPNYAFPEEGTTLRSVIFRKEDHSSKDQSEKSEFLKREYEYQRPARAALTELAPNSVFYAGNRKVTVNRVETARGENIEEWRFCQDCSYSAKNIDGSHFHDARCPRCQSNMWSDQQSKAKLLKMTQVYAFANVKDTSLDDANDNREPLFFNRQMLIDFDRKDLGQAWRLEEAGQPFGFEFIKKARFTEVNFGQRDHEGESFFVAGEDLKRAGFKICKECGTVQKGRKSEHLHSCKYNNTTKSGQETGIENCLYLYREFQSEALRILLPRLATGGTQEQLNSFVAGLQLGLKLNFGGRVDHLQITHHSEPLNEQGDRRHFVVLYDTVPGGTGYLNDLITNSAQMKQVFSLAYERMAACDCYQGEHDGCYRCLLEYRNASGMASTSKATALEMFKPLVDSGANWVASDQPLSSMPANAWIDSELEARFPAALTKYHKHEVIEGDSVRVRRDIVGGKTGYIIEVGEQIWSAELQVEVNEKGFKCKPDLVLRNKNSKPIAVFLDGFEYHKNIVEDDLLKRMSLMNSGYLVWSLTWYDINQVLGEKAARVPLLETLLSDGKQPDGRQFASRLVSHLGVNGMHWMSWLRQTSFDRLVGYMHSPTSLDSYQQYAYLAAISMIGPKALQAKRCVKAGELYPQLPVGFSDNFNHSGLFSFSSQFKNEGTSLETIIWAEGKTGLAGQIDEFFLTIGYQTELRSVDESLPVWQLLLTWFNAAQFLPNIYAFDQESLLSGTAATLEWPTKGSADLVAGELPEWFADLLDEYKEPLLEVLPMIPSDAYAGFDLTTADGEIIAEAEVALPTDKIALVVDEVDIPIFSAAGWSAVTDIEQFIQLVREQ